MTCKETAAAINATNSESTIFSRLSKEDARSFMEQKAASSLHPDYVFDSMVTGSEWLNCMERSRSSWENRLLPGNNSIIFF